MRNRDRARDLVGVGPAGPGASRVLDVRGQTGGVLMTRRLLGRDGLRLTKTVVQDVRYALRTMRRAPAFTLTVVLTLALGISANATVFSLVNALLLRPYPYRDADQLMRVSGVDLRSGARSFLSYPDLVDLRARSEVFQGIAASDREPYNLRGSETTMYVQGARASANIFDVLGVDPIIGRTFRSDEDRPGADNVMILGERLWRSAFGGDLAIVGESVTLDAEPYIVIGVVPRGAAYPDEANLWVTLRLDPQRENRGTHWLNVVGRLRPGVSDRQAQAELEVIARQLAAEYPRTNQARSLTVVSLRDVRAGDSRAVLAILLGAVGFVLLIACANVSGLLLARVSGRRKEIAIRVALGAGRGRVVGQLLTESTVLVVLGSILGLILSRWAIGVIVARAPGELPDWVVLDLDARMTAFVVGASVATTLMCGLLPALQAVRRDPGRPLQEFGGAAGGGVRTQRLRSALVVAEIALSMVLLVGAGLMIKSFLQLTRVAPGFDTEHTFMMTTAFARAKYPERDQRVAFYTTVRERVMALPGVQAVGGIARPPLRGGWTTASFTVEGQTLDEQQTNPPVLQHMVTSGYLAAAGIPILQGRDFDQRDVEASQEVVLVSRELADRYWPGEDPVGRRVKLGSPENETPWMAIIGVVGSVRQIDLLEDTGLQWYYPYERWQTSYGRITWVVRANADPRPLIQAARAEVHALDPDQAVYDVMTLRDAIDESIWGPRLAAMLFWIFGVLALALASVGTYALTSYTVVQRTREIGIRIALGARVRDILGMVLRHGFMLVTLGAVLGMAAAVAIGRVMASVLFEVSSTDPGVLVGVALLQPAVVLTASFLAARRAMKVDPVVALRSE